jgi:hypothetical protein
MEGRVMRTHGRRVGVTLCLLLACGAGGAAAADPKAEAGARAAGVTRIAASTAPAGAGGGAREGAAPPAACARFLRSAAGVVADEPYADGGGGGVYGCVTDSAGRPLHNVHLEPRPLSGKVHLPAIGIGTRENGAYIYTELGQPVEYELELTAMKDGYEPATARLTMKPGKTAVVHYTLRRSGETQAPGSTASIPGGAPAKGEGSAAGPAAAAALALAVVTLGAGAYAAARRRRAGEGRR